MTTWHTGSRKAIFGGAAAGTVAVVAAIGLASPASAYQEFQIFENTCNSDGQDCDTGVYTTVVKMNPAGISVGFVSSPDMCSDIIAKISIDMPQPHEIGQGRVSPGRGTPQFAIPASLANNAGYIGVSVHAVGVTGGCNTGGLLEWSGKLVVENSGYSLPPP
jgi:hypothetical protein